MFTRAYRRARRDSRAFEARAIARASLSRLRARAWVRRRARDDASRSKARPACPIQILPRYKERFKFSRNDAESTAKTGHRPHMAILGTPLPNVVLS